MRLTAAVRALVVWAVVVAGLGAFQLLAQHGRSRLDDPDPALQRPAFLDAVGARTRAPLVTSSLPRAGRNCVVFFVRSAQQGRLLRALRRSRALPAGVDAAVVGGAPLLGTTPVPTVTDRDTALARGFAMRRPLDAGYPVGYALVGRDGTVRYRTLDPELADHLADVRTLLRALR